MFYYHNNNQTFTSCSIKGILTKLKAPINWNNEYIQARLLQGLWLEQKLQTHTHIQHINRVPYGYRLERDTQILKRTWELNQTEKKHAPYSIKDAQHGFEHLLKRAIKKHLNNNIGIQLSGGLDSSCIAAQVRQLQPNSCIHALSNGSLSQLPQWCQQLSKKEQDYYQWDFFDETPYSKRVSDVLELKQHIISGPFHFGYIIDSYAQSLCGFSDVLFPILNHKSYQLAQELNINTLLSGFGGDEIVSQQALPALKEWKYRNQSARYQYERFMYHIQKQRQKYKKNTSPKLALLPAFSHWAYLQDALLHSQYANKKKLPTFKDTASFEKALVQGELSTHWLRRIENEKLIARHHGVNIAFPLTDPDLMQFSHLLPNNIKRRHGYGRYLIRKHTAKYLPKTIVWRNNKGGATAPAAWAALVQQLPHLFLERVSFHYQGLLADYINLNKLRETLEQGPIADPNIVHLCIMAMMFIRFEQHATC